MLELVDLKKKIDSKTFKSIFDSLVVQLGELQRSVQEARIPVIVVFEGWDAAGKGTIINRLANSLDPRGFKVHPISAPTDNETLFPWMRRFWTKLPAAGGIAFFDRSWYGRVLVARMEELIPKERWQRAYQDIQEFETQLRDSGAVLVKFWLHIDRKEQAKRFEALQEEPATRWKVGKSEREQNQYYKRWLDAVEEMLQRTSTAAAPWTIVEATQSRFVQVKVFETIIRTVKQELERRQAGRPSRQPMQLSESLLSHHAPTILDRVDLRVSLSRKSYEEQLGQLQKRLFQLEHEIFLARIPVAIVYEGADAGGKGGSIKRLTSGLDPRGYEVIPIAAPTREELDHHYLWRFWLRVPKAGHITIFDRSWYGRVLVERIEGFCSEEEWRRAFTEINQFERQLVDFGTIIVKFWLQIDKDEQLRRFQAREEIPHKRWKITEEDWRNREKWDLHQISAAEMLERTSTTYAPWTILEANDKLYARIKAMRTVVDSVGSALRSRLKNGERGRS